MLSNQKAKYIKSLQIKKYRTKHSRFLVEGAKNVQELLRSDFKVELILASDSFTKENQSVLSSLAAEIIAEKPDRISSVGNYKTNDAALAVVEMPEQGPLAIGNEIIIALDDVRDPGNLGTIIRTADWFGIKTIVASKETADFYNSKVIQASMGSFLRVKVHYEDLDHFFSDHPNLPVAAAVLDGTPVSAMKAEIPMALLMGNESNGVNLNLMKHVDQRITIPKYGNAESLNVAMSTAIICDNIRRILG